MLQVKSISFSYLETSIITNVNFTLQKGKTLAVIGESGCGKSTLLKLIYGLYDLNEGQILWGEQEVLGPKFHLIPGMEFMKYLAQDFDLMPFITVSENIGKYLSNFYPEHKKERIQELLRIVEMEEYAQVKAKYLSGGQMQRVAIARVLALEPEVLLLDEPFSHIDNFRKNSLRRKLFSYLNEKGITTIIATHDSTDVLSFAHEVIVMKDGAILQQSDPIALYQNPKIRYTASLFGDVNQIIWKGKTRLVYPHQLKRVQQSNMKVEVLASYFRGSHFLIEASFESQSVFFESEIACEKGIQVFLSFT
jgi:ABC-type sulfate/molybdate transport systems ATPase subunit